MSWLKQIRPVLLYQSSDVPYVILEAGVKLCFSNFYSVDPCGRDEFNLSFQTSRSNIERQSATYFRFKTFPAIIPFENVIQLNKTIINGKILKSASALAGDQLSVALVKSSFIDRLDGYELDRLVDELEEHDKMIILTSDPLGESSHLLINDDAIPIFETQDYMRTCVAIAHVVYPRHGLRYCWTRNCPETHIDAYGFDDPDEMSALNDGFSSIGVASVEINWDSDFNE